MLEAIKFVYQWMLPPGIFILALLLIAAVGFVRKWKGRCCVLIVACLLWACSESFVADFLCRPLENAVAQPTEEEIASCDLLVMTGAGSVGGVPDLGGLGQPSGIMGKNMLTAFRLQKITGKPLLVTGGLVRKEDGREAEIALRIFGQMGVPEDRLLAEDQSRNTVQNARFTKKRMKEMGLRRALVISPALHAPRVQALFEREGVDVVMYPSHYRRPPHRDFSFFWDVMPTAEAQRDISDALREYLAHLAILLGVY